MNDYDLGVLIQVGNYKIWNKMKFIVSHFRDFSSLFLININQDLISENEIKEIKNEFQNAIFTLSENKGMDIFGFFTQIKYIIKNKISLKYICKLHTKTDDNWRNNLLNSLCGSKLIIKNNIKLFKNNKDIGLLCPKKYLILMDHFNTPIIVNIFNYLKIENKYIDEIDFTKKDKEVFDSLFYITYPYNKIIYDDEILKCSERTNIYAYLHWNNYGYKSFKLVTNKNLITKKIDNHYTFPAGSMFWIDANILINFFNDIKIDELSSLFEKGYFKNEIPTFTHSWERMFGLISIIKNKKNYYI